MTIILITAISILVLTGLAWIAGKSLRFPVCPICVGVGATWIGMLAARFAQTHKTKDQMQEVYDLAGQIITSFEKLRLL